MISAAEPAALQPRSDSSHRPLPAFLITLAPITSHLSPITFGCGSAASWPSVPKISLIASRPRLQSTKDRMTLEQQLRIAEGYAELGMYQEALAELDKLSSRF